VFPLGRREIDELMKQQAQLIIHGVRSASL
jgi:hypothetical protein